MPRKQSSESPRRRRPPRPSAKGPAVRKAKNAVGQVVRHRVYEFRGVVFDIDPVFSNTEDWWLSIPAELRPVKDQPYYHLLAENAETEYIAYVSEQNLLPDTSGEPLRHPQLGDYFVEDDEGRYRAVFIQPH
jgi:heat shock protein HspQ